MPRLGLVAVLLLFSPGIVLAQKALPVVEETPWDPFRSHCQRLLDTLAGLNAPLPAETDQAIRKLLREGSKNPQATSEIQKLLDAHCLIGVQINPESRVKAKRGPAAAELRLDRATVVLVKVHNEAGVTHALKLSGPQLRSPGHAAPEHWLEPDLYTKAPLRPTLSGQTVEYVVLRLTAREVGKREATLQFDVGQGTQDLGFRAEVPVLFQVRR